MASRRKSSSWCRGVSSMSLSNRRKFLTLLATPLALSACGFRPIYGEGSAAQAMHGQIALGQFSGLSGFQMREQLETRLGPAENANFQLDVDVTTDRRGLAITPDGAITRYNLHGEASYTVTQLGGGVVYRDIVTAFTAYNATGSAYATRVAEQDALRRLSVTLADKIVTQMAISAEDWLT